MISSPTVTLSPCRAVVRSVLASLLLWLAEPALAVPVPDRSTISFPATPSQAAITRQAGTPSVVFAKKSDKGGGGGSGNGGNGKDKKDKNDRKDKRDRNDENGDEDDDGSRDEGGENDDAADVSSGGSSEATGTTDSEGGSDAATNDESDADSGSTPDTGDPEEGESTSGSAGASSDDSDDAADESSGGSSAATGTTDSEGGSDAATSDEQAEAAASGSEAAPYLMLSGTPPEAVTAGHLYLFRPGVESNGESPPVFRIDGLPHWAGFDAVSGELYGTPDDADLGLYEAVTISATDGVVETSLPSFSIEVVAPGAAQGAVTLSWAPPTENEDGSYLVDLAGYWIYWGNTPGSYTEWVRIDNPGLTTIVIEDLVPGFWEFAMTSFNANGIESKLSNAVTRVLE